MTAMSIVSCCYGKGLHNSQKALGTGKWMGIFLKCIKGSTDKKCLPIMSTTCFPFLLANILHALINFCDFLTDIYFTLFIFIFISPSLCYLCPWIYPRFSVMNTCITIDIFKILGKKKKDWDWVIGLYSNCHIWRGRPLWYHTQWDISPKTEYV